MIESVSRDLTVFSIFFSRKIKNLEIPVDHDAVIHILERKDPAPASSGLYERYQGTFKIKGKSNTSLTLSLNQIKRF